MRKATCHPDLEHQAKGLCHACYNKKMYADNLDRSREVKRKWYEANRTRLNEESRRWRAENHEHVKERTRLWREKNPDYFRKKSGLPEATRPKPQKCECCGKPPKGKWGLSLDHCHVTGKFRGWLCGSCNRAIGMLGDNESGVESALGYLRRNSTEN